MTDVTIQQTNDKLSALESGFNTLVTTATEILAEIKQMAGFQGGATPADLDALAARLDSDLTTVQNAIATVQTFAPPPPPIDDAPAPTVTKAVPAGSAKPAA